MLYIGVLCLFWFLVLGNDCLRLFNSVVQDTSLFSCWFCVGGLV